MLARRNPASSFLPITSLQAQPFHAITDSFAQRRHAIPSILNSFRTLLPLTAISFFASQFHAFVRFLSSIQPQVSSFQSLAASCASPKKSSPLESNKSGLFLQNTRGGGGCPWIPLRLSTVDCQLAEGSDPFKTFIRSDIPTFRRFQLECW